MRLAWFTPLSPHLSAIAAYSAAILARLGRDSDFDVDVYVDDGDPAELAPALGPRATVRAAHDFVWRQARRPCDLTVYQLAGAASHAYMRAYVVRYPGLAVLHDVVLHHAGGGRRPDAGGRGDYRAELRYERPELYDGVAGIADLPVPHLLAAWPMVRPILRTARRVAVHDPGAADALRRRCPEARVEVLPFGVAGPRFGVAGPRSGVAGPRFGVAAGPRFGVAAGPRVGVAGPPAGSFAPGGGPVVFAAVAHTACVGSLAIVLRALRRVRREAPATLSVLGALEDPAGLASEVRAAGLDAGAVTVPGADAAGDGAAGDGADRASLAAADACIVLPARSDGVTDTWMRCLAAGKPTALGARARHAGVPLLDARTWRRLHGEAGDGVAIGIDPRREAETLWLAMRRLAVDGDLRRTLGARARSWWEAQDGAEAGMIDDYRRLLREAAEEPPRPAGDLPAHFRSDGLELARRIAGECGLGGDLFGLAPAGAPGGGPPELARRIPGECGLGGDLFGLAPAGAPEGEAPGGAPAVDPGAPDANVVAPEGGPPEGVCEVRRLRGEDANVVAPEGGPPEGVCEVRRLRGEDANVVAPEGGPPGGAPAVDPCSREP